MPDQAADHLGSILQLRHVINSQLAVRPEILSQLFVPSTAGVSARTTESDDENCGMPRGCVRQHDLLASQRIGFGMRNDLRRETPNHQQHKREPKISVQHNPPSEQQGEHERYELFYPDFSSLILKTDAWLSISPQKKRVPCPSRVLCERAGL